MDKQGCTCMSCSYLVIVFRFCQIEFIHTDVVMCDLVHNVNMETVFYLCELLTATGNIVLTLRERVHSPYS